MGPDVVARLETGLVVSTHAWYARLALLCGDTSTMGVLTPCG